MAWITAGVVGRYIERSRVHVAGQALYQTTNLRRGTEEHLQTCQVREHLPAYGKQTLVSGRVGGTCSCFFLDKNDTLLLFDPFRPCSFTNTLTFSPEYSDAKLRRLS